MMDIEESLERARSEIEMIHAAYPDEVTILLPITPSKKKNTTVDIDNGQCHTDDDHNHYNGNDQVTAEQEQRRQHQQLYDQTFPFRFRLRLSDKASITMELTQGYPEDTPVQITDFRCNSTCSGGGGGSGSGRDDKSKIDHVVRSVRRVAQQCQEDGIEGAITCCSTALDLWNNPHDFDDDETDDVADETSMLASSTALPLHASGSDPRSAYQSHDHGNNTEYKTTENYQDDESPTQPSSAAASTSTKDKKYNWISGEPLVDRKSIFQAHLCLIESPDDVQSALAELLHSSSKMQRATHHMHAWRIVTSAEANDKDIDGHHSGAGNNRRQRPRMVPKADIVQHDNNDDGEDGAGSKLSYLLDMRQDDGVLVVVSRWYGGTQLGPKRFAHIVNVARELLVQNAK